MNATLGLRLTSQLLRNPCKARCISEMSIWRPLSHKPPSHYHRTIWNTTGPGSWITEQKLGQSLLLRRSPLNFLRFYANKARLPVSPRVRRAAALPPPPVSHTSIVNPMVITGAEEEPTKYSSPKNTSEESTEPPEPSEAQKQTSRFVLIIGLGYAIIHLLFWMPNISAFAHGSSDLSSGEIMRKYASPWHEFTHKWFTFSPAVALDRLGFNQGEGRPDSKESYLTKITQFILPTFSHAVVLHLACNFFALQALAPTMVRYYGLQRSLIAYLICGSLGLLFILPYDRLLNPYSNLDQNTSFMRYRQTDDTVIRKTTNKPPTKAQIEEHFKLGEHCRPALGGSGALYGFLAITAIVNPAAQFEVMLIPVAFSVRTLLMALCAVDLGCIGMRTEAWGTIGHLTGAAAGVLVWLAWLRRVPLPPDIQRALMMRLRRQQFGLK